MSVLSLPKRRLFACVAALFSVPAWSATQEPACPTVAAEATLVSADTAYQLPEVPYITPKGEFEKKADYEARVKRKLDEHNLEGAAKAAGFKAFKLTLPVWMPKYDAESERLVFESPNVYRHTETMGNRKLSLSTVSVSASSRVRDGRIGNAAIGMNTATTSHTSFGIAFTSVPNTKLLRKNAKHVLKLRPAEASRVSRQLGVVVVGRPAPPYAVSSYVSGDAMIANGKVFQHTYTTRYVVAEFVCAYVVDSSTGSPLSMQ